MTSQINGDVVIVVVVVVIVVYHIVTLYSSELLYVSGCEDLSSGVEQSTASVWTNTQPYKRYNDYSRGNVIIIIIFILSPISSVYQDKVQWTYTE